MTNYSSFYDDHERWHFCYCAQIWRQIFWLFQINYYYYLRIFSNNLKWLNFPKKIFWSRLIKYILNFDEHHRKDVCKMRKHFLISKLESGNLLMKKFCNKMTIWHGHWIFICTFRYFCITWEFFCVWMYRF